MKNSPSQTDFEFFNEFFDQGMEESVSPFITRDSLHWGKNLSLKTSLSSAFLLLVSFLLSFVPSQNSLSHLLLLFTFFLAGIPPLIASIKDLLSLEVNIDVLMTFAAFASVLIGNGQEGALLLVLFSFSGALENVVHTKAKGALSALKRLAPTKAWVVLPDGHLVERSVRDIPLNTSILVKAGQVVPLDGMIIQGSSSVNLASLTGESFPLLKKEGDEIPSGALTIEGALTLRVTCTSQDSTLARMIRLITEAQEAKPRFQRWLDGISKGYATTILLLALCFALALPLLFSIPFLGKEGSVYRSLAFLIAASPCALILALPIAYLSALSACAKQGVLLKGGAVFDALASCKTIALDKTGTLTTGELQCVGFEQLTGSTSMNVLNVVLGLERNAVHPIAKALIEFTEKNGAKPAIIEQFRIVPGYGLQGVYQNQAVFLGNSAFIAPQLPIETLPLLQQTCKKLEEQGLLFSLLLLGDNLFIFYFQDQIRPNIKDTIEELHKQKFKIIMLTGDHQENAQKVSDQLGIEGFFANLRPEDKLAHITELAKKENLAMVGDGVNDAPALARATVGISMGKAGSATAVNVSDVVLLQDNIEILAWLMEKAKNTRVVVRQNILFAFSAIILASFPALLGWIPLWLAVLVHEGGTAIVGLNALRLLRK